MLVERPLYARQPIFDAQMNLVAYELLFRGDAAAGETATSEVLMSALDHNIFDAAQAEVPVFVNFPKKILFETLPFDPQHLVIEILEDVEVSQNLIQRVKQLQALGYRIALDDFELSPSNAALLSVADIVKLDVLAVPDLEAEVSRIRPKVNVLLAEKVETHAMYQTCHALSLDYFQGYFFSRPQVVAASSVSPNAKTILRLLSALQDEAMTADGLEQIILEDTTLTYRVLKLVNSAAYRRSADVTSVSGAVTMLGMRQLAAFVSLLALGQSEHKSPELLTYTAMRGSLCREVAGLIDTPIVPDACFTLGVLSCCDAHFDTPMSVLVEGLPVHEDMLAALVDREGVLGDLLVLVQHYQEGSWDKIEHQLLEALNLTSAQVDDAYLNAQQWVDAHLATVND